VPTLLETLAAELERPRELSPRVLNYISGTYDIDNDGVGTFLIQTLPSLEDDEIDLILSPMFTPRLADQAVVADVLGREPLMRAEWPDLIRHLADRPTRAHLVTPDGVAHAVFLREVTIERYVHRLRLDAAIPEALYNLICSVPTADQPMVKAVARSGVWDADGRREILSRYLGAVVGQSSYRLNGVLELQNVVETRKPSGIASLLAGIPKWRESLRDQIDAGSRSKPFFIDRVEELHGGERDQRGRDVRIAAKENELAFLGQLEETLKEVRHE
jgi:hypothetical protein